MMPTLVDDDQQHFQRATMDEGILKAAGVSYEDVVKCTVLLSDLDNFKLMNEVYAKFFGQTSPARAAYGVVRLPMGGIVEIEAIAVKK